MTYKGLSMARGRFFELEVESGARSACFEFAEKKVHSWLRAGLRARFGP